MGRYRIVVSVRPYLFEAVYQWITDNQWTPYILVDVEKKGVAVPLDSVRNGEIILNIAPQAVSDYAVNEGWLFFSASFSRKVCHLEIPLTAIKILYAAENGRGFSFQEAMLALEGEEEEAGDAPQRKKPDVLTPQSSQSKKKRPPWLRVVSSDKKDNQSD